MSVSQDKHADAYFNKAESVVIGQLYYKKREKVELVRMTNGAVYRDDDKFQSIQDELLAQGITIELDNEGNEKRRIRKSWRVHSRMFDGGDWLDKEEETVFNDIPLAPIYGNWDIFENKSIYFGKIEKLYDQQRVLNYTAGLSGVHRTRMTARGIGTDGPVLLRHGDVSLLQNGLTMSRAHEK